MLVVLRWGEKEAGDGWRWGIYGGRSGRKVMVKKVDGGEFALSFFSFFFFCCLFVCFFLIIALLAQHSFVLTFVQMGWGHYLFVFSSQRTKTNRAGQKRILSLLAAGKLGE